MSSLAITDSDIQDILGLLSDDEALQQAFACRLKEPECAVLLRRGKLLLCSLTLSVSDDVIQRFRESPYCIRHYPDIPSSRPWVIDIQRKRYLDPTPTHCYHATPAENEISIRQIGIVPGRNVNQQNGAKYPDGGHFIHGALTPELAFEWASRIFGDKSPIVFPIHLQEAGYRLYLDTAAGSDTAFIIDTPCVEPRFLSEPLRPT